MTWALRGCGRSPFSPPWTTVRAIPRKSRRVHISAVKATTPERGKHDFTKSSSSDVVDELHGDHSPITIAEFEKAFYSAWTPLPASKLPRTIQPAPPHRLAIAVSGGVDSMALAFLCKQLEKKSAGQLSFRAIVVDHRARPGSHEEAEDVVKMLHGMDVDATATSIQWPDNVQNPLELTNFESVARTARFQALGRACRDHLSARYLLLAHHRDDQAETVVSRILTNRTGAGLGGIKESGLIPACSRMYGICEGPATEQYHFQPTKKTSTNLTLQGIETSNFDAAGDGIFVHRPLLGFSKSRLLATCLGAGLAWKEDATNLDVGLTLRNAVRWLYTHRQLPKALSKDSIIRLAAQVSKRTVDIESEVTARFQALNILQFDARSGILRVSLSREALTGDRHDETSVRSLLVATGVVRRLAQLVTGMIPHEIAEAIALKVVNYGPTSPPSFSGGGILWQIRQEDGDNAVYKISPQPHSSRTLGPVCVWSQEEQHPGMEPTGDKTASSRPEEKLAPMLPNTAIPMPFGTWQLFGNRFWLKVVATNEDSIVARSLKPADLSQFRRLLRRTCRAKLDKTLNISAPGNLRFTLPVLVSGEGRPLALPTVGPFLSQWEPEASLNWELLYKRIDPSCHHDFLARP